MNLLTYGIIRMIESKWIQTQGQLHVEYPHWILWDVCGIT